VPSVEAEFRFSHASDLTLRTGLSDTMTDIVLRNHLDEGQKQPKVGAWSGILAAHWLLCFALLTWASTRKHWELGYSSFTLLVRLDD